MNTRKLKHLTVISFLSVITITQYQNCAPAPGMNGNVASADGSVHVINPVTTGGALQFAEESVKVNAEEDSAVMVGFCREDQVGATIRWELRHPDQGIVAEGYADCRESGVFDLEVAPMLSLDCGTPYHLVALLGVSESNPVSISRNCE